MSHVIIKEFRQRSTNVCSKMCTRESRFRKSVGVRVYNIPLLEVQSTDWDKQHIHSIFSYKSHKIMYIRSSKTKVIWIGQNL